VRSVDQAIASALGARVVPPTREYAASRAAELQEAGFASIAQIVEALQAESEKLIRFVVDWFNQPAEMDQYDPSFDTTSGTWSEITAGVSLFYLYKHRLLSSREPVEAAPELGYDDDPRSFQQLSLLHEAVFGG
jgi:hypothetical protein